MLQEFKKFAIRGNVVDMAVGIIVGAAFGTIVKSLVSDVIMPPIGLLLGGADFSDLFLVLKNTWNADDTNVFPLPFCIQGHGTRFVRLCKQQGGKIFSIVLPLLLGACGDKTEREQQNDNELLHVQFHDGATRFLYSKNIKVRRIFFYYCSNHFP